MGDTRRYLAPQNQETVLRETAAELLAEEGQSVPDWEIVGPQIAAEIDRQSGQLLADASADFDAFEGLRARAVHAYGRVDPGVCGLIGVMAGYLLLLSWGRSSCRRRRPIPGLA